MLTFHEHEHYFLLNLRLIKAKQKKMYVFCLDVKSNETNPIKDKEQKK